MNWINRFLLANWSRTFHALLLTMALLFGIQLGEFRVQRSWDEEKQKIAQVQAKQEQHVADVRQSQSQITQEISREFTKRSNLLADRQPDDHVGGVCNVHAAGRSDLSSVSEASAGAAPTRTDSLPAPQRDLGEVSCEQLSRDAAQTTLMLLEIQRWYELQSKVLQ